MDHCIEVISSIKSAPLGPHPEKGDSMTIRTPLVSALLLILLPLGAALAQSTAQINGTVRDETGAAIPGVEIKATNTGTGSVRTVTTEATGLVP